MNLSFSQFKFINIYLRDNYCVLNLVKISQISCFRNQLKVLLRFIFPKYLTYFVQHFTKR